MEKVIRFRDGSCGLIRFSELDALLDSVITWLAILAEHDNPFAVYVEDGERWE